jgi:phosphatidylinositol-3-phosphatase
VIRPVVPRATPGGVTRRLLALLPLLALCGAAAAAPPRKPAVPRFRHVVVVVFENKEAGDVVGRGQAPTFDRLARRYASLEDYHGVAHPSLPNYVALVSGSTQGITNDCTDCSVSAPSLADTLERAQRTWKTYAEGLPRTGFTGASFGRYAKRHDPFVYFDDVASSPARLRRIVPLSAFRRDLAANRLPSFSLVVPDVCHDMHDCPVATGDAWLASFLRPVLGSKAMRGSVVFVVFDEGTSSAGGGGHVPALALGPLVREGAATQAALDHYGLLRTIEQAWGLPLLGESRKATPITGIWSG